MLAIWSLVPLPFLNPACTSGSSQFRCTSLAWRILSITLLACEMSTTVHPGGSDSKESACSVGDPGSIPWVRKIPWRRKWLSTPVFFPGKFHGQRSLVGSSPWCCKQLDMTEHTQQQENSTLMRVAWTMKQGQGIWWKFWISKRKGRARYH